MQYNRAYLHVPLVSQWDISSREKNQWTIWHQPGLVLKVESQLTRFTNTIKTKKNDSPFSESVTVRSMIISLPYVRSLNSKMLILQPLLQIHPQKLTRTVSANKDHCQFVQRNTRGDWKQNQIQPKPVWIPRCKENTKSQMNSDTVQIPPW